MFRLGYNTNGLAHHRPEEALRLLADLGYEAVAITPDVGGLDLYALEPRTVDSLRGAADELGLELAIETGARYLMDPRRKHFPTLLEEHATTARGASTSTSARSTWRRSSAPRSFRCGRASRL